MYNNTFTYEEAQQRLFAFERLLQDHGVSIRPGSDLERVSLNIMQAVEMRQRGRVDIEDKDFRRWSRENVGIEQIVSLLLSLRSHNAISALVGHLVLLNQGSPLQNVYAPVTDQAANKLFELVIAMAVMRVIHEVELDSPTRSKGTNPDVMFDWRGDRWAIACKALHTTQPQTIVDTVMKGVAQLDASDAVHGIVALNLKNILPHDDFMPVLRGNVQGDVTYGAVKSLEFARTMVNTAVDRLLVKVSMTYATELADALAASQKAVKAVMLYVHTAIFVSEVAGKSTSGLLFLKLREFGEVTSVEQDLLQRLNAALQRP